MADAGIDWGDISSWIAVAFTAWGLVVQHRSAHTSETDRKRFQQKLRIETLISDIDDLCSRAVNYWMKPEAQAAADGILIVSKVRDISSRTTAYSGFLWESAASDFIRVKMRITGGQFQVSTRQALPQNDPTIAAFMNQAAEFKAKLRAVHDQMDIG